MEPQDPEVWLERMVNGVLLEKGVPLDLQDLLVKALDLMPLLWLP